MYNVHPIPAALHEFIFDFGALSPANEVLDLQGRKQYEVDMMKMDI